MQSHFQGQFRGQVQGFPQRLPPQLIAQIPQQHIPPHAARPGPSNGHEMGGNSDPRESNHIPPPPLRLWNSPNTQGPPVLPHGFPSAQHPDPQFPPPQSRNGPQSNPNSSRQQFQRPIPEIPPPLPTQDQLDQMHHQMHKRPNKQLHPLNQPHHQIHHDNPQHDPSSRLSVQREEIDSSYQSNHQRQSSDEDHQRAIESNQKYEALFKALGEASQKHNQQSEIGQHQHQPSSKPDQQLADDCPWQRRSSNQSSSQSQQKHQPFQNPPDQKMQLPPPPIQERVIPQVPGPCDPEDLIDGVLFSSNYLGSTQLKVDKNSTKTARMMQAQEAMTRVKGNGMHKSRISN